MEHTVEQAKMESLKALADTNLKISEAQNALFKLQETETQYLVDREDKAIERIGKMVAESESILSNATENYYETTQFYHTVSSFAQSLTDYYEKFKLVISDFEERNTAWEESVKKQEELLRQLQQKIDTDKVLIMNDRKTLEMKEKSLAEEKTRVTDMRQTIEREIIRLNKKNNG